jgi:hypothetical protein
MTIRELNSMAAGMSFGDKTQVASLLSAFHKSLMYLFEVSQATISNVSRMLNAYEHALGSCTPNECIDAIDHILETTIEFDHTVPSPGKILSVIREQREVTDLISALCRRQ